MIIVEGPDGAGKTTLVNHLLDKFGDDLVLGERGTTNRDDLWKVTKSDTYRAVEEDLGIPGNKPDLPTKIWDRLFWSEFVYWDITGRDKPEFNDKDVYLIPRMIAALRSPVIWCLPEKGIVVNNIMAEGHQMDGVEEKAETIYLRYAQMAFSYTYFPPELRKYVMLYDYTGMKRGYSLDWIEQAVAKDIERRKARLS